MQAYRMHAPPRGLPVPAEAEDGPASRGTLTPADGWSLEQLRARSERLAQSIRARNEWIEARRAELWARMDRMRGRPSTRVEAAREGGGLAALAASAGPVFARPAPPSAADALQELGAQVDSLIGTLSGHDPAGGGAADSPVGSGRTIPSAERAA